MADDKRSISQRALGIKDMPEAEQAHHAGDNRIVTDDAYGDVLRWLATSAAEIGEARRQMILKERLRQSTEAILTLQSDQKSVEMKKADARASEKWMQAAEEEALAAGNFEQMKALREAALAKHEAWRSETASRRGGKA